MNNQNWTTRTEQPQLIIDNERLTFDNDDDNNDDENDDFEEYECPDQTDENYIKQSENWNVASTSTTSSTPIIQRTNSHVTTSGES